MNFGALRRVNVDEEAALLEMAALVLDTDGSFVKGSERRRIASIFWAAECSDLPRYDRTLSCFINTLPNLLVCLTGR